MKKVDIYFNLYRGIVKMLSVGVFCGVFALPLMGQSNQQSKEKVASAQNIENLYNTHLTKRVHGTSDLNKIISVDFKMVSLLKVLKVIADKVDLRLAYDTQLLSLNKSVTVSMKGVTAEQGLWKVLENTDLRFAVSSHNHLVIMKSNKKNEKKENQFQQVEAVSGTVTDAGTGEALPGVNIKVKGTTTGTFTNDEGHYELGVSSLQDTLVFSFVGYQKREVSIDGRTTIDISLKTQAISGEEMVVVGYGEQKRSDLTGSVSSVSSEEFEDETVSSFTQSLQGKVAGLTITTSGGEPGSDVRVRIRGSSSILGSNDPLYVVDGFPIQSGNSGGTSLLSTLNSGNIKSIEVLKDASATAIYGSRGSNGVIIITTKEGERGNNRIEVESSIGFQNLKKKIDMMNSKQYIEIANERQTNDGNQPYFKNISDWTDVNTDWQDEMFRSALLQNHSVRFTGGNKTTRYAITGNYYDEDGIIKGSDFKRGSFRLNLDQKINSFFNIKGRLFASRSENNQINTSSIILSALQAPPFFTPLDKDGSYTPADSLKQFPFSPSSGVNPLAEAQEQTNSIRLDRILANVSGIYDLRRNLSLNISLGMDKINNSSDLYNPSFLYAGQPGGVASKVMASTTNFLNNNTLNYNRNLRSNDQINVTAGFTWQHEKSENLAGSSSGFVTDELKNNILGSGEFYSAPNTNVSEWTLLSWLGRINYSLNDRYLFTLTGRMDGSSRFGEGNKWAFFPSGAFAWRLSQEDFIKQIHQISNLKLRISWGRAGNQAISPYQSLQRYSDVSLAFGGSATTGFAPANIGNPDLRWEKTEEINFGLDIGLWNSRININTNYYIKDTDDLLAEVNLPPTSGYSTIIKNIGSIRNQGFELEIGADILRKENTLWDISFNTSINHNEVLKTSKGQDIIAPTLNILGSANIIREGEPLSAFYGLEQDGLTEDGLFNYVDQNGDGEINSDDRVILGSPYPDFTYGLSTSLTISDFLFKVSVQGKYGNQIWNNNRYRFMSSMHRGNNQIADVVNRWRPDDPNPDAPYPKATSTLNQQPSDWYIEDGSYLRLKNVQLTYNLPVDTFNSAFLKSASIYISGQNLLTLTGYSWYTPDVNSFGSGDLRIGVDQRSYPVARKVTLGVKIGF